MLEMNKEMTNQQVSELLRKVAAAFEVKDGDFFRVKAYENAAASIEHVTSDLHDLWEENKLSDIPGIGPNLKQHLDELFRTGKVAHFIAETKDLPEGMFALLDLPGVGAKTAFKLAKAFKLYDQKTALEKLKKVTERGEIRKLEGFGDKSEEDILKALSQEKMGDRMLLSPAFALAQEVMEYLKLDEAVEKVEVLGSLRRRTVTVGDVDLAVATKKPEKVMEHLLRFKGVKKVLSTGLKTTMFIHSSGRQVDVKTQDPNAWGSMLQHYTGSKLHNIQLRTYALGKKMSLSENGIKYKGKVETFKDEGAFYKYLGLDYIPPELREDVGEIEAALKHRLPRLIEEGDLRGDLHVHTNIDIETSHDLGMSSVNELLAKARLLNYEYLGLSDHNPKRELSLTKKIDLLKRRKEKIEKGIDSFRNEVKTRVPKIFVGMEVDIRSDGSLALEDVCLDLLDYAIVSIHAVFDQEKKMATERVLRALSHPKVRFLGHPTGRKLQKRQGLDYDWEKVFDYCRTNDKWLEVNASVDRQDLPDMLIREAINGGVKLIVDTDSHAEEYMGFMKYGIWNARRGWAEKKDVVNTLPGREMEQLIRG